MIYNTSKRFLPILNSDQPGPPGPGPGPDYSAMPVTFKSTGTTTIQFYNRRNVTISQLPLSARYNGAQWAQVNNFNNISLYDGDTLELSGSLVDSYNWSSKWWSIISNGTGTLELYGNLMALRNWENTFNNTYQFAELFCGNSRLVDATKLVLPAPTLSSDCYRSLLKECSILTGGPLLPATTLVTRCYNQFCDTSKLQSIEVKFTEWSPSDATSNWIANVSSPSGIFIKPQSLNISRGTNAIPNNWIVLNRIGSKLYYAETTNGHTAGDEYLGEDPYAWYY